MKPHFLLAALLAVAACSSSSSSPSTGNGAGDDAMAAGGDDGGSAGSDTWATTMQPLFAKYCVECHTASDPTGRDFTQQSIVAQNKLTIRCGVAVTQDPAWMCGSFPPAKQFPISDMAGTNPKPSDDERNRVVAWVDAGCP
jgi:hypothetical protein